MGRVALVGWCGERVVLSCQAELSVAEASVVPGTVTVPSIRDAYESGLAISHPSVVEAVLGHRKGERP